jgi:predicted nuclease with TOPRIM domain
VKCDENKVESTNSAAMEFSEIPGRFTMPPINQAAEEIEQSTSRRRSESSSSSESDDRKNKKIRKLEERLSEMEKSIKVPYSRRRQDASRIQPTTISASH